jgi:hypothetical protein
METPGMKKHSSTTTRQRIDLLARDYPRFFSRADLVRLVRSQLGDVDALDRWILRDSVRVRARAPQLIYHVCAGNLAISAIISIAHGLLLGAHNEMKLPGPREDNATRREIIAFVGGLPKSLRDLVHLQTTHDERALRQADVVIAFGGEAAMTALRAQLRGGQKFIAHGPAVSLLWIDDPGRFTTRDARACATDVLTYDQLGCLSPQAIYVAPGADLEALGHKLSLALESHWHRLPAKPPRPLGVRARIAEARDVARALGHRMWLPPSGHLGWTLIHDPDPTFAASPLHGVIYLRSSPLARLEKHLAAVHGCISTVGVTCAASASPWRETFLKLGVSRFCRTGRMQFPPLSWHHDGRASLGELVTWMDDETAS